MLSFENGGVVCDFGAVAGEDVACQLAGKHDVVDGITHCEERTGLFLLLGFIDVCVSVFVRFCLIETKLPS